MSINVMFESYFKIDFLFDILSKDFNEPRPGLSFIVLENSQNDNLCKIRPRREIYEKDTT